MAMTHFNLTRGHLGDQEMLRMEVRFDDDAEDEPVLMLFIPKKHAVSMAWQILEEFEFDEKEEKKLLM